MESGIYKITCIKTGKFYIGSSKDIKARVKRHFSQLKHETHINPHLQNAYNLYGEYEFKWEIIENCSEELLIEREQYWLDETKCYDRMIGFNNTIRADRPLGYKHTDESKIKMSKAKKGKPLSEDHVKKIKNANTGKKRSPEFKKLLSESRKGSKNPMWGIKETDSHKKQRMKNMLDTPRWNTGLKLGDDPRLEKLRNRAGQLPHNVIKCKLINKKTNKEWTGYSLKDLASKTPISLSTINRLKIGTVGKGIKETYKLELL